MSNHEGVIPTNIIFNLRISFEAKIGQLLYLDSDYKDNVKEKVSNYLCQPEDPIVEQHQGLIFSKPILVMTHHLKPIHITTNFNNVPV